MKPRNMSAISGGKRYRTETATLLASGPFGMEPLRQTSGELLEPILEIRVGGVELGALVMRGLWEGQGWSAFLFRTHKGNYFVQHQLSSTGERIQLVPLDQSDAVTLYEKLSNKEVEFKKAFPGVEIEDA